MTVCAQRGDVRVYGFRKAGHTSIINTFLTREGDEVARGDTPLVLNTTDAVRELSAYRGMFEDRLSWPEAKNCVAFVRHPVKRSLSAYMHFIVRGRKDTPQGVILHRGSFNELGFRYDMTFDDFCTHLLSVDLTVDPHITPQMEYLFREEDEDTFILSQLELIDFAWGPIMSDLGVDCPRVVAHMNEGHYNPEDHVTPYAEAVVEALYADDMILWRSIDETRAHFSTEHH